MINAFNAKNIPILHVLIIVILVLAFTLTVSELSKYDSVKNLPKESLEFSIINSTVAFELEDEQSWLDSNRNKEGVHTLDKDEYSLVLIVERNINGFRNGIGLKDVYRQGSKISVDFETKLSEIETDDSYSYMLLKTN